MKYKIAPLFMYAHHIYTVESSQKMSNNKVNQVDLYPKYRSPQ